MCEFKVEANIKEEFLSTKPTATAQSNIFVLKKADEYESLAGKSVYDMSVSELREMIAMQFRNTSTKSVAKDVSIIKMYIDFCISKNLVKHMENRLTTFTIDEAKNFVSKHAINHKYTSPEQLKQYQNMLENAQDRLLLELPFIGVRGRTSKEGTLEEIINLKIDPKSEDFKNCILTLVKNNGEMRQIKVSQETMDLVLEAYEQEEYIGNNGEETGHERVKIKKNFINKFDNYVLRNAGKTKYEPFNPVLINSRMNRIQKYIGNEYITINSLYASGMMSMAKEIFEQKGRLDKEDYLNIAARFEYGDNPERYWGNIKQLVEQYKEVLGI